MKLVCKSCKMQLGFTNINIDYYNIDGSRIKGQCKECAKKTEQQLKEKYFVETYKK